MLIEDRDFLGRVRVANAPVPIPTAGTVLIRTAYSWRWPGERQGTWPGDLLVAGRLLRAAVKRPWRALQHGFRYLIQREPAGLNLALDHHVGAHKQYVTDAHKCFSISGRIEESADGVRDSDWPPGTLVSGLGFKSAPYASFHVVSRQFLLKVPNERALRVASLLVPAAMVRYGMKLALARSNAKAIVVIGWDAISRLAACYGLASAADVALVGTEQELSSAAQLGLPRYVYARAADAIPLFSKLKRPTLFVLGTTALSDLARSVLDALASHADVRGLWIQCAHHQSSDNVTRLASPRLDVVSIPDPWNDQPGRPERGPPRDSGMGIADEFGRHARMAVHGP